MKPRPLIPGTPEWDEVAEAMERMGRDDPWEGMSDEEIQREREEIKQRLEEGKAALKAKYDAGRDERRRSYFSRVYGLSMEDFTTLMRSQKDRCAACKLPFSEAKDFWPCVDHDHATGQIRGLLCRLCNLTLGHAHDNPEILHGLLRYLETRQARLVPARPSR